MKRQLMITALALAAMMIGLPTTVTAHESSETTLEALNGFSGNDTVWRHARDHAVARFINPADYECGPTDFDVWIIERIVDIGPADFSTLRDFRVLDWPTFYTLLFDQDATDDFIGVNGEHTRELLMRPTVTDAGLKHLSGLKKLQNLYVWQTKITELSFDLRWCHRHDNSLRRTHISRLLCTLGVGCLETAPRRFEEKKTPRVQRRQRTIQGSFFTGGTALKFFRKTSEFRAINPCGARFTFCASGRSRNS